MFLTEVCFWMIFVLKQCGHAGGNTRIAVIFSATSKNRDIFNYNFSGVAKNTAKKNAKTTAI